MKINHFFLATVAAMAFTLSSCGPDPCTGFACFDIDVSSSSEPSSSSVVPVSSSSESSSSSVVPISSSSIQFEVVYDTPVIYEGETYQTVVIGEQTWFQRNLNYEPSGTGVATNSQCYNNEPANCTTYGRLYDWATVMKLPASCNTSSCASSISTKHQGICPSGWHIPSNADWEVLMTAVGGSSTALKAKNGWNSGGNGEDKFGFAALPGGGYAFSAVFYCDVGNCGGWWTSLALNVQVAYLRYMDYSNYIRSETNIKDLGRFSIRCLKD